MGVSATTTSLGVNDPEPGYRLSVGDEDYVFVYNAGNSTISQGHGAVFSGVTGYSVTVSSVTSTDFLVGVCKHTNIATATYGWLVTRGFVAVEMGSASATVSTGGLLELGDDGEFYPVSNTTANGPVVGKAMNTIATDASGVAFINVH
jgi:hypothetical protein